MRDAKRQASLRWPLLIKTHISSYLQKGSIYLCKEIASFPNNKTRQRKTQDAITNHRETI